MYVSTRILKIYNHIIFYRFDLPCHEIVYEDKGKVKKWNRLSKKHKHGGVVAAAIATGSAGCASVGVGHKSNSSSNSGSGAYNNNSSSPTEGINQQIDPGFLFHLQELKEFLMLEKSKKFFNCILIIIVRTVK